MAEFNGTDGDDTIYTQSDASDVVRLRGGNDFSSAVGGNDSLYGEAGDDTLNGGNDNDLLDGDKNDDELAGGNGNDSLIGGAGKDSLYGSYGADALNGGKGDDYLDGGLNSDDTLDGGKGNDTLRGSSGDDVLDGGAGTDEFRGDSGADRYVFDDGDSGVGSNLRDVIVRLEAGEGDRVDLRPVDGDAAAPGDQGLTYIGTQLAGAEFTGAGQVRVVALDVDGDVIAQPGTAVADYVVQVNTGGSTAPEMEILVDLWGSGPSQDWFLL